MRTRFFSEQWFDKSGKQGLQAVVGLSEDARSALLEWFRELDKDPRFDKSEIRDLVKRTRSPAELIARAVRTTHTVLTELARLGDRMEDFLEDLREVGDLPESFDYDSLNAYLLALAPEASRIHALRRFRSRANAGGAVLTGSSMVAALKPVYRKSYAFHEGDVTEYRPEVIGYVPVAQFELEVSPIGGGTESLFFQLGSGNLERFIADVLAVQREFVQLAETANELNEKVSKENKK